MPGADVAPGDREEARQPGLARQEVVAALVQLAVEHVVADREQLAMTVLQEAERHARLQRPGREGDRKGPPDERGDLGVVEVASLAVA